MATTNIELLKQKDKKTLQRLDYLRKQMCVYFGISGLIITSLVSYSGSKEVITALYRSVAGLVIFSLAGYVLGTLIIASHPSAAERELKDNIKESIQPQPFLINVSYLEPGMKLFEDAVDDNGTVIIPKKSVLSKDLIDRLIQNNIVEVKVEGIKYNLEE